METGLFAVDTGALDVRHLGAWLSDQISLASGGGFPVLSLAKRPISQVLVSFYFEQPREVAGCSRQYSCLLVSFPKSVFIFLPKRNKSRFQVFRR